MPPKTSRFPSNNCAAAFLPELGQAADTTRAFDFEAHDGAIWQQDVAHA
jgi:hypothetical protein